MFFFGGREGQGIFKIPKIMTGKKIWLATLWSVSDDDGDDDDDDDDYDDDDDD